MLRGLHLGICLLAMPSLDGVLRRQRVGSRTATSLCIRPSGSLIHTPEDLRIGAPTRSAQGSELAAGRLQTRANPLQMEEDREATWYTVQAANGRAGFCAE